MNNQVLNIIETRHSKRSFLNKEVPLELIKNVLRIAGNAPSSKNTQPWQVSVVTGKTLTALSLAILEKFNQNLHEGADFHYMLEPIPEYLMQRAKNAGAAFFELKGIDRANQQHRLEHECENYRFFGAPVQLIFHLPKNAERGNFLDMGFYMQNVMLGLQSEGISSCAQFSIAEYPDTIRQVLGITEELWIVSGLACGYADDSKINTFVPKRIELDEYARFYE